MDWQEQKYNDSFEDTIADIETRRQVDPDFGIAQLEILLHHECIHEGHGWDGGKGILGEISHRATIDAYETLLAKWRKEAGNLPD